MRILHARGIERAGPLGWCLLALTLVGCHRNAPSSVANPTTYPVRGKLVSTAGAEKFAGATIAFVPDDRANAQFTAVGEVQPDGAFTLYTLTPGGARLEGAMPGVHRATLTMPLRPDQSGGETIALPGTHTVQSQDNEIEIAAP